MTAEKSTSSAPAVAPRPPAVTLPEAPPGQMTLRVNGKDHFIDPKKYRTLIEALRDLGYKIPHFCYHPGLKPDGNCRICYVNMVDPKTGQPVMTPNLAQQPFQPYPKPVISCREPLNPKGMIVETETPAVLKARQWVMEFLLINHPLDCAVCDKAGECKLQDYSYAHGNADSRFEEAKNEKAPKDLSAPEQKFGIKLWTDRCILCSRCVRFLDEISGTNELQFVNRGDRTEIDIAPGHWLNNPLMGNVVDICPVGALIDRNLMFTYRAWYLRPTKSVCPACAKGCNIVVDADKQFVRRLRPRENVDVNGWWMCDYGRHDFHYVNSKQRVLFCRVNGKDELDIQGVAAKAGARLKDYAKTGALSVAGLASAWLTVEELLAFKQLFHETLGRPQTGALTQPLGREEVFPKFTIEADKNPNRAGLKLVLGADFEEQTAHILEGIHAGRIKALYLVSDMPHYAPPAELLGALKKLEFLVVQDMLHGPLTESAHVVLPGSSFTEKDGVFVNSQNRAQLLRRAIDPLAQGHDDLTVLQAVLRGAGAAAAEPASAREVLKQAGAPLADLTHQALGEKGLLLAK
ncbi:MAG: molybdopterin-dependent oxidoreductase [Planctomycetota bacterium]